MVFLFRSEQITETFFLYFNTLPMPHQRTDSLQQATAEHYNKTQYNKLYLMSFEINYKQKARCKRGILHY